ncbi:class I SAM-dependent methyltransferase [Natronococcus wangiae]|uniref:class I SAM-dependent methyltransferase n=1 Tax=Natronococcus wangiae TaxID=3068275 RepID=UPI00273D3AD3|nr:class I SAM-dependent methyltransferase [Natronococcus sp. AD5]
MDEVSRTRSVYESDIDTYVDKYLSVSIAERYGEEFCNTLDGNRILDVGCGPGSDLATFTSAGYNVVGLDVVSSFLQVANSHTPDASLVQGDMRQMPFQDEAFDGIWSSASFLHIPRSHATDTLQEFRRVLQDNGVIFLSVKRNQLRTDTMNGRYFEYYQPNDIRYILSQAGFSQIRSKTDNIWVTVTARKG